MTLNDTAYDTNASSGLAAVNVSISSDHMPQPPDPPAWEEKNVWHDLSIPRRVESVHEYRLRAHACKVAVSA